jgi:hypothetical protein
MAASKSVNSGITRKMDRAFLPGPMEANTLVNSERTNKMAKARSLGLMVLSTSANGVMAAVEDKAPTLVLTQGEAKNTSVNGETVIKMDKAH